MQYEPKIGITTTYVDGSDPSAFGRAINEKTKAVFEKFKDEIEKIRGVASASISGGAEEQILVAANGLDAGGGIPIVAGMRLEVPALGHHRDDLVSTFFLNLFFHAKISSMPPKLLSDDGKQQRADRAFRSFWVEPASK